MRRTVLVGGAALVVGVSACIGEASLNLDAQAAGGAGAPGRAGGPNGLADLLDPCVGGGGGEAGAGEGGEAGAGEGGEAGAGEGGEAGAGEAGAGAGGEAGAGEAGAGGEAGSAPVDPTWECLGKPLNPPPTNAPVGLTLAVLNGITRTPAPNAVVRACARVDPACNAPVAADTPVAPNGLVSVQVPLNFDGFFEVRSTDPDPATAFVPELGILPPREIMRGALGRGLLVFTRAEVAQLTGLAGGSFDPEQPPNGLLIVTALNCESRTAPAVSFSLTSPAQASPQTRPFYLNQGFPNPNAAQTDPSGVFGLTNLFQGNVTVTGTIAGQSRPLVTDAVATVRDGWITILFASP
jgi:hypothetical protein